jgi:hypothetical protein
MVPSEALFEFIALDDSAPIDPVRLQYGIFFAESAGVWEQEHYRFEPYSYGPMSLAIYRDIRMLVERGLIEGIPQIGMGWSKYRAATHDPPSDSWKPLTGKARTDLLDIRGSVCSTTMRELLCGLREDFPDHASRLIFAC